MKKKRTQSVLCFLLILAVLGTTMSGCSTKVQAEDMMKSISSRDVSDKIQITEEGNRAVTDFAVRLFKESMGQDENTLLSPISVLYALSMTANGADGNTLAQMEDVLGMSVDELNNHLGACQKQLSIEKDSKLYVANSIWFRDSEDFTVKEDFLQVNADYYHSAIYKSDFEKDTRDAINAWVKKNTDGMIDQILEDEIPDEALMYLVNALAFESKWQEIYEKDSVRTGTFTKEDGTEQEATMMYSEESVYLEDERATGFIKPYADGRYVFAALLPNEGVTLDAYVSNLTGEELFDFLNHPTQERVEASLPKFESEYSIEMSGVLKKMGMTDAFEYPMADFSKLGTLTNKAGVIAIDRILHKTYISVAEKGTKAGAATAVEMLNKMSLRPDDTKRVYLDRPFLYMIIDTETNTPIFMGTVKDI